MLAFKLVGDLIKKTPKGLMVKVDSLPPFGIGAVNPVFRSTSNFKPRFERGFLFGAIELNACI